MHRMITTQEAARRLGVKVPTLYAYVSRGLLHSHPDPSRRGSLFELDDVEALARRSRVGRETATRLATVTTGVTRLDLRAGPVYRGRPAVELAEDLLFEQVAELLWHSEAPGDWRAPELGTCPLANTFDRMRWALLMCGATDNLRADLRPEAVARAARRSAAALTAAVGAGPPGEDPTAPLAERLAARLATQSDAASGPCRQRRARALGRSRAGHLHHGRAHRRIGASRPLRRAGGGAGHLGRSASRRCQPDGLRVARCSRARWSVPRPERRVARARPSPWVRTRRVQVGGSALRTAVGLGLARIERGSARARARGARPGGSPRRAGGQLRPCAGCAQLGDGDAVGHRTHHLRRGPDRRVGGPLHGGTRRAAAPIFAPAPCTARDATTWVLPRSDHDGGGMAPQVDRAGDDPGRQGDADQ